jgi:hypothetical protein
VTIEVRCDWCGAAVSLDDPAGVHADTGGGVIHFCGIACMNACLSYSAALLNCRAVYPAYIPSTRQ